MTIRQLPPAPSRDRPNEFSPEMDAFLASMQGFADDANALEQSMQLVATTGTSSTVLTVGVGSKALVTQAGKAWATGAWVYVFAAAAVSNYMVGRVTSYDVDTGDLVVNVSAIDGSGSHSSWIIGLATPVADDHLVARDGSRAMTAELLLSGNAVNALGAVPKQQAESIAASAVANRMQYSISAAVATTSGNIFDFTGFPAWAKRVTFIPNGVSTTGSQGWKLQLFAGGVLVTSGYRCVSAYVASVSNTTSWSDRVFDTGSSAASLMDGGLVFSLSGSNRWSCVGVLDRYNDNAVQVVAGSAALADILTGARLSANSSDTFDGGYFTVLIEG